MLSQSNLQDEIFTWQAGWVLLLEIQYEKDRFLSLMRDAAWTAKPCDLLFPLDFTLKLPHTNEEKGLYD